jgi:DNA-binding MarR family transcriptional regulator
MTETTEEAVLLALETRQDLFESLYEMLSSDNYVRVLMEVEEGKAQGEIADEVGTSGATVSRAVDELEELELIEETNNGYTKTLPALDHPMIQHFYETEVLDSG